MWSASGLTTFRQIPRKARRLTMGRELTLKSQDGIGSSVARIVVIWLSPLVLALAVPPVALAGSSFDSRFQLVVIEENANLSVYGRDRHYTNGAQISLLSPRLQEGSFVDTSMGWLGQNTPVLVRPGATTDNRLE